MIHVGQRVQFDAFATIKSGVDKIKVNTIGTVVYINAPHDWFSVQYGDNQRTSFKFSQVGKDVIVIG